LHRHECRIAVQATSAGEYASPAAGEYPHVEDVCERDCGGGEEGKENKAGDGRFKVAAGEFTFEVSNPNVSGKGALGLREGSSGSVNALVMPQNSQRLSLAWKPAEGAVSRNGSPVRFGGVSSRASMRSVGNLGLYDGQGFLISASPVRGVSPSGLRV
jgi:hypothetical protein